MCQQGPIRERLVRCGSALERGNGTAPEPLAQLGDALGGVGALAHFAEAAEVVAFQAASSTRVRLGMGAAAGSDMRAGAMVRRRTGER